MQHSTNPHHTTNQTKMNPSQPTPTQPTSSQPTPSPTILIMAGGLGKRMNSTIPKVLHCVNSRPMLIRCIEAASQLNPESIIIITPKSDFLIKRCLFMHLPSSILNIIVYIPQLEPLGTGHAVKSAEQYFSTKLTNLLIMPADVPLISTQMLSDMWSSHLNSKMSATILTTWLDNPTGNGRIILDTTNTFIKIQEEKDCSPEQKQIQMVNAGLYVFKTDVLFDFLKQVGNSNAQREYYLTDVFELMISNGSKINTIFSNSSKSLINVNSPKDLALAESV